MRVDQWVDESSPLTISSQVTQSKCCERSAHSNSRPSRVVPVKLNRLFPTQSSEPGEPKRENLCSQGLVSVKRSTEHRWKTCCQGLRVNRLQGSTAASPSPRLSWHWNVRYAGSSRAAITRWCSIRAILRKRTPPVGQLVIGPLETRVRNAESMMDSLTRWAGGSNAYGTLGLEHMVTKRKVNSRRA
ncbi:hypothetical protein LshimejAT787_0801170 [Lyophyllum shimeji]|uniref:Uncharacterized protein n=1 Tax=Lyophyllum shimeji TaxID=47721 RepID=A0A9P3PRZ2_LYOSH|nr:hypothetical protein LshimejAT787_0801170 [Lyophyllum shimeji]